MNFIKYLKTAFVNRWHLLALFGVSGLAVLSGRPDIWLPMVAAGEITYLGMLGSHPKFQKAVDAQDAKQARAATTAGTDEALNRIIRSLPDKMMKRFSSLRQSCLELRQIAVELRQPGPGGTDVPLEDLQLQGLDRLLWIYLRLLYTQYSLERFLERTRESDIQQDIASIQEQLARVEKQPESDQKQKATVTLQDNLQTCRDRLTNYQKAQGNHELLQLEISRLENKIRSLSELAVNRHEPDFIAGQVDQVASSMVQAEHTMNELEFATGLRGAEDEAPELLRRSAIKQTN